MEYRDHLPRLSIGLRKNLQKKLDNWRYVDNGYFLNSHNRYVSYILYRCTYHGLDLEQKFGSLYCRTTTIALDIIIQGYQAYVNYYFVQHGLRYLLSQKIQTISSLYYLDIMQLVHNILTNDFDNLIIQAFDKNLHDVAYNQAVKYLVLSQNRENFSKNSNQNLNTKPPRHKHNIILQRRYR